MSESRVVEVINLSTNERREYVGISAEQAVIAAYAQGTKKDWNTWTYQDKYGHMVSRGKVTVGIGDWCAFSDEFISKEK